MKNSAIGLTLILGVAGVVLVTQHFKSSPANTASQLLDKPVTSPQRPMTDSKSSTARVPAPGLNESAAPSLSDAELNLALRDLDVHIDSIKREASTLQDWVDRNEVKKQLNSEYLSETQRNLLFDKLSELGSMRKSIVELRLKKIEMLDQAIRVTQAAKGSKS